MNGQILKKYQQKELNLMRVTCKKTRNYIFFFAAREAARKLNKRKRVTCLLQRTKRNQIQQNFHSFTFTDNI